VRSNSQPINVEIRYFATSSELRIRRLGVRIPPGALQIDCFLAGHPAKRLLRRLRYSSRSTSPSRGTSSTGCCRTGRSTITGPPHRPQAGTGAKADTQRVRSPITHISSRGTPPRSSTANATSPTSQDSDDVVHRLDVARLITGPCCGWPVRSDTMTSTCSQSLVSSQYPVCVSTLGGG
jgi:hypothetical protein